MNTKQKKGLLLVISGPSGTGKGSMCQKLLEDDSVKYSISATTRAPRGQEQHGKEYFFLTKEEFEQKIEQNGFLEWAQVYDRYYGTPRDFVEETLHNGYDCILEIDVQGALKVKEAMPEAVLIFILPPSLKELYRRINERGTESAEQIKLRMSWVLGEIDQITKYDYAVVNDSLDEAVEEVRKIRHSEKCRVSRLGDLTKIYHDEDERGFC